MTDQSLIGATGVLIVPTRGSGGLGEVELSVRGGTETYLARSEQPLAEGVPVLVVDLRGARTVQVEPVSDFTA